MSRGREQEGIWQNEQIATHQCRRQNCGEGEVVAKHKRATEAAKGPSRLPALCCGPGDYVRVGLSWGADYPKGSVWIRVDYCDDQRGIVYGTIDDEPLPQFKHALRQGAKLAASYGRILECQGPS